MDWYVVHKDYTNELIKLDKRQTVLTFINLLMNRPENCMLF
jgi:hypothetical protein